MKRVSSIAFAVAAGASLCAAQSPLAARVAPTAKAPAVTSAAAASSGGFLMNVDICTNPHTNLGTGNVAGVVIDTTLLTTGTTGQNEAGCLFFGLTGITNDGWGRWTAATTGTATATNCGNANDSKIAIWQSAGTNVCPAVLIACNDDACGLQSSVGWGTTAGTTYTVQIGSFPGAAPGAGSWSFTEFGPPPCGQKDNGTTENALGLTAGGEIGWLTVWETGPSACDGLDTWDSIETAYGTAMFPGSVTNGANSQVVVYHDADTDNNPTTGLTVTVKVNTLVVNGDTDILNKVPLGISINKATNSDSWVLVSADQVGGQFPAPMDQDPPTHAAGAWIVGSTLGPGTLNTTNLLANDVAPLNMAAIGFPANFLSRVDNTGGPTTGTALCFGDGTGTNCPCLNPGGTGAGCANGTGAGGVLSASGTASVTADTMSLTADGVINNNGLFFQGNNTIGGGTGVAFGDGIRCCGGSVVRIQVVNPPGVISPATAQMTETATTNGPNGTVLPGVKKCYQFWYRDPATSPCGTQFNLTNAVTITWQA